MLTGDEVNGSACLLVYQVRSIGLHAAKASIADPTERLDFFTLDFHGERSALHGSIVWKQVRYFLRSFSYILRLES